MTTIADLIRRLEPCADSLEWAEQYPADQTQKAWDECPNGFWLWWLFGVLDHRTGCCVAREWHFGQHQPEAPFVEYARQFADAIRVKFPNPPELT